MSASHRVVLGSRGSALARVQAEMVRKALAAAWPELEIEIEIIRTSGDEKGSASFQLADPEKEQAGSVHHLAGRKGLFTSEIERALGAGEIDIAVHSAKDLPSESNPQLEIRGALPRAAVEDVLVMMQAQDPASLPAGAIVATGSVRRQHQLRWRWPQIEAVELRGNVPTRVRKLLANDWSGIILAGAGLERLGYDLEDGALDFEGRQLHLEILPLDEFLPAGGQGAIALQVRRDDSRAKDFVDATNDGETLSCLRAEREFLRRLQGDCGSPVGVFATLEEGWMRLRAQVFEKAIEPRIGEIRSLADEQSPEEIATALFEKMYGGKK